MDTTCSSGEDLFIKTRKPYTITKQRERWTEEEHNTFLEALKLYGRSWQRIEEHIGTKTAVQIRSHAQKFFSKLEKEALSKGVPIGQAIDIDIPPPRPKRKPSNPYPRKTCTSAPTSQIGVKDRKLPTSASSLRCNQLLDLEKEPIDDRPNGDENSIHTKEHQEDKCSEVYTLHQEAHGSSVSSVTKNSTPTPTALRNSCILRELVPSLKEVANHDEAHESYTTVELQGSAKFDKHDSNQALQDNGTSKPSNLEKSVHGEKRDDVTDKWPTAEMQATQNYPRHVAVHIVDGCLATGTQSSSEMPQESIFHPIEEVQGNPSLFTNPAASGNAEDQSNIPRSYQSFPIFHPPLPPFQHNSDDYRSFPHISSTFSSVIISTLLQNPAAHAAASFAATFWPYANMETSGVSPACPQGGLQSRQMSSPPSMAALAAATVAAATAWWAAHGLIPLCAVPHPAFSCPPASATAVSSMDTAQDSEAKIDKKENTPDAASKDQQLELESPEALHAHYSTAKSPTASTSNCEASANAKLETEMKAANLEEAAEVNELHDLDKTNTRKQVDRSSCGSNCSSEVEMDALEKQEKGKEEFEEIDPALPGTDIGNRRSRSNTNIIDAWKEVSEGGRLAFQALFSREVLPQSFSPPQDLKDNMQQDNVQEDKQNANGKGVVRPLLDLSSKAWGSCFGHQETEKDAMCRGENSVEEGLLTIGLGYGKMKSRRTGFKPYRRCSLEARENRVVSTCNQAEEKCPKRIRLDGEAST